jgi:hypothetical protein
MFSINELRTPDEVSVAWYAVVQHRQAQTKPPDEAPTISAFPDGATAELAQRIYKGLTWRPLGLRYQQMFQVWLDAPSGEAVKIEDLATRLNTSVEHLRANLSKLSARMKRIATTEEIANVRTPFQLLADIEYDARNSSQHRLTAAGKEAARKYLDR